MTEYSVLQERARKLANRRERLIIEIGELETKKMGIVADYWELGRRLSATINEMQEHPQHNACMSAEQEGKR